MCKCLRTLKQLQQSIQHFCRDGSFKMLAMGSNTKDEHNVQACNPVIAVVVQNCQGVAILFSWRSNTAYSQAIFKLALDVLPKGAMRGIC